MNAKQIHRITLPDFQSLLWLEVAKDCGLRAFLNNSQVNVAGEKEEIDIAWGLFVEKFEQIVSPC